MVFNATFNNIFVKAFLKIVCCLEKTGNLFIYVKLTIFSTLEFHLKLALYQIPLIQGSV